MKMASDTRNSENGSDKRAELLIEALPWIKNITGKTIVIKYGGSAMVDEEIRASVMNDILLLKLIGANIVIVHGGGKAINKAFDVYGIDVEFIEGQRVTSAEAMEVVRSVLCGEVNQSLVRALNVHGNLAVGLSGVDGGIIVASSVDDDLGRVGKITKVNKQLIDDLLEREYIPVIATVGLGKDGGFYNINADLAAGYIAAAIKAHKIIYMTDVDGLYKDFNDKSSLISNASLNDIKAMIDNDEVSTGMIPKLKSCIHALSGGVFRAHILNGCVKHSILLELLTDDGIGTSLHCTDEACLYDAHPLGRFASKLTINN